MSHPKTTSDAVSDLPAKAVDIAMGSEVPVVIANACMDDMPLVAVNNAFCTLSGYSAADMLGKNCRFMQPADGVGPVKDRMRAFLGDDTAMHATFVVPNARNDDSRFLNLLHLSKITRSAGAAFVIGSQFDVTTQTAGKPAAYCKQIESDLTAIETLCAGEGWTMEPPDISLSNDLKRIADYQELMGS